MSAPRTKEQKLVVVGSGGVGKSAITIRFVTSQFQDQGYNPTIEDSYRKQFVVDDEAVTLEILDTAGQEEYSTISDQWYMVGAGFLLVYSITDRPTFEALPNFYQDILRVKDRPYVPCVVVSNKCDLGSLRQVDQLEGRDMAKSISAPFIECSAVNGVNVDTAFSELVKLVRRDQIRTSLSAQRMAAQGVTTSKAERSPSRGKKRDPGSCDCVLM